MVTDAEDEEPGPIGDEVPATEVPETRSAARVSPWLEGTAPPRSINKDRSFISRAWMSSGFPCESADTSLLTKTQKNIF